MKIFFSFVFFIVCFNFFEMSLSKKQECYLRISVIEFLLKKENDESIRKKKEFDCLFKKIQKCRLRRSFFKKGNEEFLRKFNENENEHIALMEKLNEISSEIIMKMKELIDLYLKKEEVIEELKFDNALKELKFF